MARGSTLMAAGDGGEHIVGMISLESIGYFLDAPGSQCTRFRSVPAVDLCDQGAPS